MKFKKRHLLLSTVFLLLFIFSIYPLVFGESKVENYVAKVVERVPHWEQAYTQGLFFYNGALYESSGEYGKSFFHEVDLKRGRSIRSFNLDPSFFAEGATVLDDKLYILTWKENRVLVYDIKDFKPLSTLFNPNEGWGLTTDGKQLIATDGSSNLYFYDPSTFTLNSKVEVTLNGKRVNQLNELEFIKGEVWANIYGSETIVIINPKNGKVRGSVDCSTLLPIYMRSPSTDVLNGIAYNPEDGSIYVTGKNWPTLFRIELLKQK